MEIIFVGDECEFQIMRNISINNKGVKFDVNMVFGSMLDKHNLAAASGKVEKDE